MLGTELSAYRRMLEVTLPVDRRARMDQRERADKIEPTLAAEPIENTEASEPADATDRIEPTEPIDRIEPAEPIDRIEPLDPMLRMEPDDPNERDEPGETRIATFWQAGGSAWPWVRQNASIPSRSSAAKVTVNPHDMLAPTGRTGRCRPVQRERGPDHEKPDDVRYPAAPFHGELRL